MLYIIVHLLLGLALHQISQAHRERTGLFNIMCYCDLNHFTLPL